MRTPYTPANGSGVTYEIESDRHGSYTVMLRGKVVKRVTALASYLDRPRWGSRRLQAEAIDDAKRAIEALQVQAGSAGVAVSSTSAASQA